jgi:predicted transposase/invertase (TIGR01784 family)
MGLHHSLLLISGKCALLHRGYIKGEDYNLLKKTICINILNFILLPQKKNFFNHYIIVNEEDREKDFDEFGIFFFELPKFRETPYNESEPHTLLEKWTVFLSEQDEDKLESIAMQEHAIKEAYDKLKYLSADKDMQYLYHKERMREIGEKTNLRAAKEEGKEEGLAEGKAEGLLEGKRATAKNLKSLGVSFEIISKSTGLSLEEVEKI